MVNGWLCQVAGNHLRGLVRWHFGFFLLYASADFKKVSKIHFAKFCILYYYFRQGHLSMVVQLMKYGADPSLIDGEGCSCIHLAAQFGHTSIVAYLIAKGQVCLLLTLF